MANPAEPPAPPNGYTFLTGELTNLLWNDPSGMPEFEWPSYWGEVARYVFIHDACGCFVAGALVETHNAWHATLGG